MKIVKNQADLKEIIIRALSQVSLFEGLSGNTLSEIAELAKLVSCKKDTVIFKEGDNGDKVYIIVTGLVKIYRQSSGGEETELKKAVPCEVFGELSLLDGHPRSTNAKAQKDSILFYITRESFLQFIRENPEVSIKLLETMSHRLREVNEITITTGSSSLNGTVSPGTPETCVAPVEVATVNETLPKTGENPVDEEKEKQREWVYSKKFTCPLCRKETTSMITLSKYVQAEKTDTDMCTYYRLVNPSFYYVIVCTHCGFAFTEDAQSRYSPKSSEQIEQKLPAIRSQQDFSGLRSMDEAISTYHLAIDCQTLAGAKSTLLGRLYLRLSCLYRQKDLPAEETEYMGHALEHLEKAFSNEGSKDPRGEINLIYLIGELHGRLGRIPEAIKWFNRVITHPDQRSNPYIVNKARDRWQEFKYQNQR